MPSNAAAFRLAWLQVARIAREAEPSRQILQEPAATTDSKSNSSVRASARAISADTTGTRGKTTTPNILAKQRLQDSKTRRWTRLSCFHPVVCDGAAANIRKHSSST